MIDARKQRAEELAVRHHAADRDAAESDAVIGPLAADEARAARLAIRPVIGDGDLERRVGGLRARIAEQHMIEIAGREACDPAGKLECLGVPELEGGREIEFRRLRLYRAHDRLAAMARIRAPQAGRRVQNRRSVRLVVMHVPGADDHSRLALELPVGGEGQPVRVQIVRARRAFARYIVGAHGANSRVTEWHHLPCRLKDRAWPKSRPCAA